MRFDEGRLRELAEAEHYTISDLLDIMRALRCENGCPWDREQNHQSIARDFVEECYEAVEAIEAGSAPMMREELGDVLLQVVFHCEIAREDGDFDFEDVCDEVCRKLVTRHPHVFGDVVAKTSGEVLKNWDRIKSEGKSLTTATQTLEGVSKALPALMYAQKLGARASRAGMDFADAKEAFGCVGLENAELAEAMESGDSARAEDELGDLLFSCVNTARLLGIDAETALRKASGKFLKRFAAAEQILTERGEDMKALSQAELDAVWADAKARISSEG